MRASGVRRMIAVVLAAAGCADAPNADTVGTQEPAEGVLTTVAQASEAAPQTLDIARLGVDRGAAEAPVHIVEFSDYGCGYCRKFHEETWPVLLRDFVDAGKVEWKFLPYVSGMFGNTTAATTAAECVLEQSDTLFHVMNSLVWGHQNEWKRAPDPASILRGLAHQSGAEPMRYDSCISQGRRAQRIEEAGALARQLGVRGTPTFFVMGYPPIQGALPTDTFVQILAMVYDEVTRAAGAP